ncbi:MAG: hypothetical protein MIO92_11250, partial [Methanosarcinaceae archaeon]|nr:hypothetical protein [Methanosarcinaceae archaeon]
SGIDGRARLWNVAAQERVALLNAPGRPPMGSLTWNPDGTALAVALEDPLNTALIPSILIWELEK